jgi:hypothetical protein
VQLILERSECLRERASNRQLRLIGGIYNAYTGGVDFFEPSTATERRGRRRLS